MPTPPADPSRDTIAWGLCGSCRQQQVITTDRGSRFVQCRRARVDPAYPKYPVVPVRQCAGYDPAGPTRTEPP